MPILQPRVEPNPTGKMLTGKTAVVTGASAGLGLETSRQLIDLGVAILVLAVRNTSKGDLVKKNILDDTVSCKTDIRVMQLDLEDPRSVVSFAAQARAELPSLDILILNAGLGYDPKFELSPAGHERLLQVNVLSNAILLFELLPLLEAGLAPSRVTWIGSRMHHLGSRFRSELPSPALAWLDNPQFHGRFTRYQESKLVAALFFYEFAARIDSTKLEINMMCPGMVTTNIDDKVPFPISTLVKLVRSIRSRRVELGGWLILHSAVHAGSETHGRFLGDREIEP